MFFVFLSLLPFHKNFVKAEAQSYAHYYQQLYWNGKKDLIHCSQDAHTDIHKQLQEIIVQVSL